MVAYEQVTAQLNGRMGIIQAALERDQVRMEHYMPKNEPSKAYESRLWCLDGSSRGISASHVRRNCLTDCGADA